MSDELYDYLKKELREIKLILKAMPQSRLSATDLLRRAVLEGRRTQIERIQFFLTNEADGPLSDEEIAELQSRPLR